MASLNLFNAEVKTVTSDSRLWPLLLAHGRPQLGHSDRNRFLGVAVLSFSSKSGTDSVASQLLQMNRSATTSDNSIKCLVWIVIPQAPLWPRNHHWLQLWGRQPWGANGFQSHIAF